jgi:predicted choloylglycine hydrolase
VDARNYYARLKIIIESAKLKKSVITNFRSICSEKIPRQITFSYLQDNEILNKIETNNLSTSRLVFLKMDKLKDDIKSQINSKIKNKEYNLLYDDGDYVLIEI